MVPGQTARDLGSGEDAFRERGSAARGSAAKQRRQDPGAPQEIWREAACPGTAALNWL